MSPVDTRRGQHWDTFGVIMPARSQSRGKHEPNLGPWKPKLKADGFRKEDLESHRTHNAKQNLPSSFTSFPELLCQGQALA